MGSASITPEERSLLDQCSVFRGGFSLEAAQVIVVIGSSPDDVARLIRDLEQRSLLRKMSHPGEGPRWFQPSRARPTDNACLLRHARYYIEHADEWLGALLESRPVCDRAFAHLCTERKNLAVIVERFERVDPPIALAAAEILRSLVSIVGPGATVTTSSNPDPLLQRTLESPIEEVPWAERLDRASRLLRRTRADGTRALVLEIDECFVRGTKKLESGDLSGAREDLEHAVRRSGETGNPLLKVAPLRRFAHLIASEGSSIAEAAWLLRDALECARLRGDRESERMIRIDLAKCAVANRQEQVVSKLLDVSTGAHECDDVDAALVDAIARLCAGDYEAAEKRIHRLLAAIASSPHGRDWEAMLRAYAGACRAVRGDPMRASEQFGRAQSAQEASGRARDRSVIHLLAGLLDVERAKRADTNTPEFVEHLAHARDRVATHAGWSLDELLASTVLQRGIRELESSFRTTPREGAFRFGAHAQWMETPSGARVDLAKRQAVRHILEALLEHRFSRPGEALSVDRCIAAGWPGERLVADAGSVRLYSAIYFLRKSGLGSVLENHGDGYRLDPSFPVHVEHLANAPAAAEPPAISTIGGVAPSPPTLTYSDCDLE